MKVTKNITNEINKPIISNSTDEIDQISNGTNISIDEEALMINKSNIVFNPKLKVLSTI